MAAAKSVLRAQGQSCFCHPAIRELHYFTTVKANQTYKLLLAVTNAPPDPVTMDTGGSNHAGSGWLTPPSIRGMNKVTGAVQKTRTSFRAESILRG